MKKLWCILLLLILVINGSGQLEKFIPPKPARPRMFNDENAFAYYHTTWRKLEDKLIEHAKHTGKQLVWVTIPTTGGNALEELASATFRSWGIGNKESNTGLLVLVARKEKQVRIETGYGLEGEVPDIVAGTIIREIIQPSFDSTDFILAPQLSSQGYLPAVERAMDTLISLTSKPDPVAMRSAANGGGRQKKWMNTILIVLSIVAGWALIKRGWWWFNQQMEKPSTAKEQALPNKRKRKAERTTMGQYIIPVLLLLLVLAVTLLFHWQWIIFIAIAVVLLLRWIYYLPSPKLSAETIRFNKEWEAKRAALKKEYAAKKKLLGTDKQYASFDEYWTRYLELGLDKLEKELGEGHYAPKAAEKKKRYGAGALLYDIFLGSSAAEKKRSSSVPGGYSGNSTGGQQAGDLGGGSSGGGGATG